MKTYTITVENETDAAILLATLEDMAQDSDIGAFNLKELSVIAVARIMDRAQEALGKSSHYVLSHANAEIYKLIR